MRFLVTLVFATCRCVFNYMRHMRMRISGHTYNIPLIFLEQSEQGNTLLGVGAMPAQIRGQHSVIIRLNLSKRRILRPFSKVKFGNIHICQDSITPSRGFKFKDCSRHFFVNIFPRMGGNIQCCKVYIILFGQY